MIKTASIFSYGVKKMWLVDDVKYIDIRITYVNDILEAN